MTARLEQSADVAAQLGTSAVEYVTAGTSEIVNIDALRMHNTSASAVDVTVYRAAAGEATLTAAHQSYTVSIPAGETRAIYNAETLASGTALFALASTADVVNLSIQAKRGT